MYIRIFVHCLIFISGWDIPGPLAFDNMQFGNAVAVANQLPSVNTLEHLNPTFTIPFNHTLPTPVFNVLPMQASTQMNAVLPMGLQSVMHHSSVPNTSVMMTQDQQFIGNTRTENINVSQNFTFQNSQIVHKNTGETSSDYDLCLCKIDFSPFSDNEAAEVRKFLVSQIFKTSVSRNKSWAPSITIKGIQTRCRFQVLAENEASKQWLLKFNFSKFPLFDIMLYTKEELWYERAAIWLPGISRAQHIEPLVKLKLQNKCLEGVNLDKWKLVKTIVTTKGIRIYVDIPPSSRQALEKYNMLLSYELVKVTVYMKSATVDSVAFNAGLQQPSVDIKTLQEAMEDEQMPIIKNDLKVVRIGMRNVNQYTIEQVKQIKSKLVNYMFRFHQNDKGRTKTDFVKYGFCPPGFFAVLPENKETEKWLTAHKFGTIGKNEIVALSAEVTNDRFIRLTAMVPYHFSNFPKFYPHVVLELLHKYNKEIKNLFIGKWKIIEAVASREGKEYRIVLDVDLESLKTLSLQRRPFMLRFEYGFRSFEVKFERDHDDIAKVIKQLENETKDSYVVTNMELDSDNE